MLVLSRKKNEIIVLICPDGTRIEVSVVRVSSFSVRLGVIAPREVLVIRKELLGSGPVRTCGPPPRSKDGTPGKLVLTRKREESIVCRLPDGQTFDVTIVRNGPYQVRLGFSGTREIRVYRKELLNGPTQQTEAA